MEVTLITLNVITLDNLMQMSTLPARGERKKKKKVPEYVFSLKYLVQGLKNSPAQVGSGVPNFGDLSPILPAHISSLFPAVIISVYDGEPL